MTEELCSTDAYLRECEAVVTVVTDEGVVLDRTVCYPRGGGQPGDTATLRWDGGETRVVDTVKSRETGEVVHAIEGAAPALGTPVSVVLDWERRYTHMRTHTALHALSGIVFGEFSAKVTGGNMESGGIARIDRKSVV